MNSSTPKIADTTATAYTIPTDAPEADGTYTLFYTGFEQAPNWDRLMAGNPENTFAIGLARVRIVR